MAFTPKTRSANGAIRTVTLGVGEHAVTLGGQNVMPFYSFDGQMPNLPKVGLEICDVDMTGGLPGLEEFYRGCTTMESRALRAQPYADFLCLHFVGADPAGANRSVEDCVADAVAVAKAVKKPLVIAGCRNLEKDTRLLPAVAKAIAEYNPLIMSVRQENCPELPRALAGMAMGAESADDISLAKQLNILLKRENAHRLVMDIGTAPVGYGYEYVASTFDRIRLAALEQADEDLQAPILALVCCDTYTVKESTAEEADAPGWGDREQRAVSMEVATAAADLTGGADAVVLRHPQSAAAILEFVGSFR